MGGHRVRKCAFWKKFLPQLAHDNGGAKRPAGCGAHCCNGSGSTTSSSRSPAPMILTILISSLNFIKLTPQLILLLRFVQPRIYLYSHYYKVTSNKVTT